MQTILLIAIVVEAIVILFLLDRIQNNEVGNKKKIIKKRTLKDINNGDVINVEAYGKILGARVFNNCPSEKKIVLTFKMTNGSEFQELVPYHSIILRNFHALNNVEILNNDLKKELNQRLDDALRLENFEEAAILRDTISKLNNPKN